MKKFLAGFLSLCMVASMVPTAALATSDFSDMPSDYSTEAVQNAVKNGLLGGSDGKILPNENLTRAQMAAILVRAFGAEKTANLTAFTDVAASAWYYKELSSAVHMGIFKGEGSTMRPNAPITRQEAFVVLARAFNLESGNVSNLAQFADASSIAAWAKDGVAAMVATGFVKGDGNSLKPLDNISRKDFAVTMDRMVETYIKESGTVTTLADGSVIINKPNVTLKGVTVKGNLIIGDGVGEGDVTLDKVTVTGSTLIRGGGTHSIYAKNGSDLGAVVIAKVDGGLSLKLSENSKADSIEVASDNVTLTGVPKGTQVTVDAGATGAKVNGKVANAGETVTAQPETPSGGGGGGGSSGGGNTTPSVALAVASGKDANLILTSTDDNTVQLTATPSNLGSSVSYAYASSNAGIARVSETGLVEAANDGTATITVTATYDTNKTVKASVGITVIDNTKISNANELKLAVASNAPTVTLDANIAGTVQVARNHASALTIALGDKTVENLSLTAPEVTTIAITAIEDDALDITGTLTINAPKASVSNGADTKRADIVAVSNTSYTPTRKHEQGLTMRRGNLVLGTNAATVLPAGAKVTVAPASKDDAVKLTATAEIPAVEVTAAGVLTVDAPVEDLAVQAPAQVEITKDVTTATVSSAATVELTGGSTGTITVTGSDATVAINGATITNEIAVEATGAKLEAVSGTIATITKTDVATDLTIETVSGATITENATNVTPVVKVKVTLNTNDGQCDKSYLLVTSGAAVGTLPIATKLGYTFNGWFTAASDGTEVTAATTVADSTTYHAQWTANSYTIAFDANGGTGTTVSVTATYDVAATLTANAFTKTGYTFVGWATYAEGAVVYADQESVKNLVAEANGSVTLYAKWKIPATVTVSTAEELTAALDAAKAGDIIQLAAGTFASDITLDKKITLKGAGQEQTTLTGTVMVTTTTDTGAATIQNLKVHNNASCSVDLRGVKTNNGVPTQNEEDPGYGNVAAVIKDCTIVSSGTNKSHIAILNRVVYNRKHIVYNVTVEGVTFVNLVNNEQMYRNIAVATNATGTQDETTAWPEYIGDCKLTVTRCTFSEAAYVIDNLNAETITITENTFNQTSGTAVQAFVNGGNVTITGNTFNGAGNGLLLTVKHTAGNISGNTFKNCDRAIKIAMSAESSAPYDLLSGNTFEGSTIADISQSKYSANKTAHVLLSIKDIRELKTALDLQAAKTIHFTGTSTLDASKTIREGVTVIIDEGATLTVAENATLTVAENATLTVNGTLKGVGETSKLIVEGTANMTAEGGASTAALATGTYTWKNNAWTKDASGGGAARAEPLPYKGFAVL